MLPDVAPAARISCQDPTHARKPSPRSPIPVARSGTLLTRRDCNVYPQLVARVIGEPRRKALSVVLIGHYVTRRYRLNRIYLTATLYRRHGGAEFVIRAVCHRVASNRAHSGTDGRTGHPAVAVTHLRAQQTAGNTAYNGAKIIVFLWRCLRHWLHFRPALLRGLIY